MLRHRSITRGYRYAYARPHIDVLRCRSNLSSVHRRPSLQIQPHNTQAQAHKHNVKASRPRSRRGRGLLSLQKQKGGRARGGRAREPCEALEKTTAALKAVGWDDEGARVQASIMVSSEACGNNQGLVKMFKPELMAPAPGAGKPVVERETASSAVIKGNQSPGMLALTKAVDLACAKAKGGVASVGVYDTSTSGQLAFYGARRREGRIVIITANSPEFVAAKAARVLRPTSLRLPGGGRILVFDMSTAAIALFGVSTCKAMASRSSVSLRRNELDEKGGHPHRRRGGAIANFGAARARAWRSWLNYCAALAGGAVWNLGQDVRS